jgi:uncharacterized membrane protein
MAIVLTAGAGTGGLSGSLADFGINDDFVKHFLRVCCSGYQPERR